MVDITITVTAEQATAFQEALTYWNEKHEASLTPTQMVKRLVRQFYRDTIAAKRNETNQTTIETEIDGVWSE